MAIIDVLKEKAKADKKTIVLPESEDRRTYEAAAKILKEGIADIILVGSEEDVKKNGEGLDLTGIKVVDPATSESVPVLRRYDGKDGRCRRYGIRRMPFYR